MAAVVEGPVRLGTSFRIRLSGTSVFWSRAHEADLERLARTIASERSSDNTPRRPSEDRQVPRRALSSGEDGNSLASGQRSLLAVKRDNLPGHSWDYRGACRLFL
jgi:hypothetical protein